MKNASLRLPYGLPPFRLSPESADSIDSIGSVLLHDGAILDDHTDLIRAMMLRTVSTIIVVNTYSDALQNLLEFRLFTSV